MVAALTFNYAMPSLGCSPNGAMSMFGSYKKAKAVFMGKIVSFEKRSSGNLSAENIRGTYVLVKEAYKGNILPGDILFLKQGNGADCGYWFDGKDKGGIRLFSADKVSKSGHIKAQDESKIPEFPTWPHDLLFLRNAKLYEGKTRISGVLYIGKDDDKGTYWYNPPSETLFHIKVKIIGLSGSYETTSDENGVYEIYGLPPGLYFIQPVVPDTLAYSGFIYPDVQGLERTDIEIGKQYLAIEQKYPDAVARSPQYVFLPPKEHAEISLVYKRK